MPSANYNTAPYSSEYNPGTSGSMYNNYYQVGSQDSTLNFRTNPNANQLPYSAPLGSSINNANNGGGGLYGGAGRQSGTNLPPYSTGGQMGTKNNSVIAETRVTTSKQENPGCDGVVCCLGCMSFVPGVKNGLVRQIAFLPPIPPGYFVTNDDRRSVYLLASNATDNSTPSAKATGIVNPSRGANPPSGNSPPAGSSSSSTTGGVTGFGVTGGVTGGGAAGLSSLGPYLVPLPDLSHLQIKVEVVEIQTSNNNNIYSFYFKKQDSDSNRRKKTIVFSHGNSTDIGFMFSHFRDLCHKCNCDLFAYDYSGYGLSTGDPSEKNIYADIQAVYCYLTEEVGLDGGDLILYGQSVGSAPSVDLASQLPEGKLAGVVLHSGMKSGLAVVHRSMTEAPWFDVFQNVSKIKDVACPVFVIHGTSDREVPFEHGVELHANCKKPWTPWWVHEGGHNDIEVIWRSGYFLKLRNFVENCNSNEGNPNLSSHINLNNTYSSYNPGSAKKEGRSTSKNSSGYKREDANYPSREETTQSGGFFAALFG